MNKITLAVTFTESQDSTLPQRLAIKAEGSETNHVFRVESNNYTVRDWSPENGYDNHGTFSTDVYAYFTNFHEANSFLSKILVDLDAIKQSQLDYAKEVRVIDTYKIEI